MTAEVIFNDVAAAVFDMVSVEAALVVLTGTFVKEIAPAGATLMTGATPDAVKLTVVGLVGAFDVMVTVPAGDPAAVGVKTTSKDPYSPGSMEKGTAGADMT